jgi:hypothetical protein
LAPLTHGWSIRSGGAAAGININSGGQEAVTTTTGGVDDSSTVNSGGTLVATGFGATSIGLFVNGGHVRYINANATAINPFDAGIKVISPGALVSGLEVRRNGVAVIEPGATVIATSVGGSIVSTGEAVVGPGGSSTIFASNATNVAVGNGATEVDLSGGTATGGSVAHGLHRHARERRHRHEGRLNHRSTAFRLLKCKPNNRRSALSQFGPTAPSIPTGDQSCWRQKPCRCLRIRCSSCALAMPGALLQKVRRRTPQRS